MTHMTGTTEHLRVSEAILKIVQDFPEERIRLKDLMDGLGERSFGFLLLIFGIACAIAPPGFATIFSMPLILFALQMVAGFDSPWRRPATRCSSTCWWTTRSAPGSPRAS